MSTHDLHRRLDRIERARADAAVTPAAVREAIHLYKTAGTLPGSERPKLRARMERLAAFCEAMKLETQPDPADVAAATPLKSRRSQEPPEPPAERRVLLRNRWDPVATKRVPESEYESGKHDADWMPTW